MRYRLRTLLIVLALGPLMLAGAWWGWKVFRPAGDKPRIEFTFRGDGTVLPTNPDGTEAVVADDSTGFPRGRLTAP